ncbi:MAG TPA: GNAT family N-acetyltransferase [Candidatus Acidoferrales bacterium]
MKKAKLVAGSLAGNLVLRPRKLASRNLLVTPLKSRQRNAPLRIRRATPRDTAVILGLVRGLAKYERLLQWFHPNAKRFRRHGFGRRRYCDTLICTQAGRPIGFALYYFTYSTFACRPILFVEDLFVLPDERGQGAGKLLMSALARVAIRQGCSQMAWNVLHWNTSAIKFYRRLGAGLDKTWLLVRLGDAPLHRLARSH